MIHNKPYVFNNEKVFNKMKDEIFLPAIDKFNVEKKEQSYVIEFFTRGVVGIVIKWLEDDCVDSIEHIVGVIYSCVGLKNKQKFDIK